MDEPTRSFRDAATLGSGPERRPRRLHPTRRRRPLARVQLERFARRLHDRRRSRGGGTCGAGEAEVEDAKPPPPIGLQFESLTAIEAGYQVFARKRQIGAVIGLASGQYAAWNRDGKIGEFVTLGQAESAVRAADRAGVAKMTDALSAACDYIERGWAPIPVPFRTKGPLLEAWQTVRINAETAPTLLQRRPAEHRHHSWRSVRRLVRPRSRLLRSDRRSAVSLARTAVFGHASKRASHWIYQVKPL